MSRLKSFSFSSKVLLGCSPKDILVAVLAITGCFLGRYLSIGLWQYWQYFDPKPFYAQYSAENIMVSIVAFLALLFILAIVFDYVHNKLKRIPKLDLPTFRDSIGFIMCSCLLACWVPFLICACQSD